MKLQKRLGRRYQGKEYHKWIVVIPHDEIISAGFKEGDDLKVLASNGKITLVKD